MLDPEVAIDRINAVFGHHPGHRALHAKGAFYSGTFTASAEAAGLCTAGHLQGEPVPVWVRWSNGGGDPRHPDTAPDVRGMAVSFRLPDGTATDLLGQTSPRFPVDDPEAFVSMTEAVRAPWKLPLWLARHPSALPALAAGARAKALAPPSSYAVIGYYPIHAYAWVAPDGTRRWVRYVLRPLDTTAPDGAFSGPDRLREEIVARLDRGPVRFDLRVTLAAPGDDPHRATSVWHGQRELSAGVLEVTGPDPEREAGDDVVVFDPTRVVEGIELSDDPILRYRPAAYSASVARRT